MSKKKPKTVDEAKAGNVVHFMKRGPALSAAYTTFIVARDRKKPAVLLGGLGGMGVGEMWFDEEERHKSYPGYDEAPDGVYCDMRISRYMPPAARGT